MDHVQVVHGRAKIQTQYFWLQNHILLIAYIAVQRKMQTIN